MRLFEHKLSKHQIRNINLEYDEQMTIGARIADAVASFVGSWHFIIIQSTLLALWITLNSVAFIMHWDGYPYILLNLALSFQAAYSAPFIMMSQNRQSAKDRLTADHDYQLNIKAEEETRQLIQHLYEQDAELLKQTNMLIDLLQHMKGINS